MKQKQNNLDERQEQLLLKIEHNGFWFAFWGLFIVMMVQLIIFGYGHFEKIIGETIVFLAIALYLIVDCLRNGIWDRHLKADRKTNLRMSFLGGACAGLVVAVTNFISYGDLLSSVLAFVFTCLFTFGLCCIIFSFVAKKYRKRCLELESEEDDEVTN